MLSAWRNFQKDKPKTKKPFAFCGKTRGVLSFENGYWEFIAGKGEHKLNLPASFLKGLMFMDDFRGKKRCTS